MKTWTIRKRIIVGFAVILTVTGALGVFAKWRIGIVHEQFNIVAKTGVPAMELLADTQVGVLQNQLLINAHIGTTSASEKAAIEREATNAARWIFGCAGGQARGGGDASRNAQAAATQA